MQSNKVNCLSCFIIERRTDESCFSTSPPRTVTSLASIENPISYHQYNENNRVFISKVVGTFSRAFLYILGQCPQWNELGNKLTKLIMFRRNNMPGEWKILNCLNPASDCYFERINI